MKHSIFGSTSWIFALLMVVYSCQSSGEPPAPVSPVPTEAQVDYQRMEFNGFVHFNMNTFTNMEWGYGNEDPSLFNPTNLNCDQWVSTMKEAGMKGVIITAKHHDGFCLWPSEYTEHSVKNSPWKNGNGDVIKELSESCAKHGLKFGVYLSPWDRNHKDYGKPEYITYFRKQLTELLTQYGDIFEVWFDGANGGDGYYGGANETRKVDKLTYYDWENTYDLIYELQPHAIIFSDAGPGCRWIGNENGYAYKTTWSPLLMDSVYGGMPEYSEKYSMGQEHGTHWVPGEADVSIRPGWYYHPYEDHKVKSLEALTDIYYKSIGRNATLLLNFPVDKRGLIHERDREQVIKLSEQIAKDFKENLIKDAKASSSESRGKRFNTEKTMDDDPETYWAAKDQMVTATLTYTFQESKTFNRIVIQEHIRLGQRVRAFNIEVLQNGDWNPVAKGTTIGYKRILRIPDVTGEGIRLNIEDSRAAPTISNFAIFHAPPMMSPPKIQRTVNGQVHISVPDERAVVYYTTNGSEPTTDDQIFDKDIDLPRGGLIKAISSFNGEVSETASVEMDIAPGKWSIVNAGNESFKAIDLDENTWWAGDELILKLNEALKLKGFTYLPTQQRYPTGFVEKYSFYTSMDGEKWKLVARGEFSNINNNPIEQRIPFEETRAAYIKFVANQTADDRPASIAELGIITR
ncbi:alpha-L-fucosidase [Portibacter marinus]|uniref:alpha-L-fucosidase n=1 Tax=Portibacter marinus TaxID=2898660 RepID=UPI001F2D5BC6|nr:alpha-L-fucosidase [Portibacter marinus]